MFEQSGLTYLWGFILIHAAFFLPSVLPVTTCKFEKTIVGLYKSVHSSDAIGKSPSPIFSLSFSTLLTHCWIHTGTLHVYGSCITCIQGLFNLGNGPSTDVRKLGLFSLGPRLITDYFVSDHKCQLFHTKNKSVKEANLTRKSL